jgi:uncharacterized membrane protein (DUF2068 family)
LGERCAERLGPAVCEPRKILRNSLRADRQAVDAHGGDRHGQYGNHEPERRARRGQAHLLRGLRPQHATRQLHVSIHAGVSTHLRTLAAMEHPLRRPELLVCSWRGHSTPGATVYPLDERHAVLVRETVDGRRLVQCLRCRGWVVTDAPAVAARVAVEHLDDVEQPRRGRELRQAIVVRVIAIDRVVHTIAFAAVGAAALALRWNFAAVHGWAQDTLNALESARRGQGGASTHGFTAALLTRLGNIRPESLVLLATFAAVYAVISAFEAVGLWRERRWAEYLTALTTAGFLPIEIHALLERVTLVRVGALAVNVAILVYLVVAKHLFGVRGGVAAAIPEPLLPLPELVPPSNAQASSTHVDGGPVTLQYQSRPDPST